MHTTLLRLIKKLLRFTSRIINIKNFTVKYAHMYTNERLFARYTSSAEK